MMKNISGEFGRIGIEAFLVTDETNVSYLSGFSGHDSMLFIAGDKKWFITDSRYIEEAKDTVKGFEIVLVESSTYTTIKSIVSRNKIKKLGFESMNLPYEVAYRLKKLLAGTTLIGVRDLVENARSVKEPREVSAIKNSIRLAKKTFSAIAAMAKPGISEKTLSKRVEMEFLKNGARSGFDPIVASGVNSSKPHAQPTERKIRGNDFVMIDIGCNLNNYNSDITRMVVLGKIKDKFRKIYDIVRTAHDMAIKKLAPGVRASEIDRVARAHIGKHGFGAYFGHSLGHGVGMSVHELPNISNRSDVVLRPGMVFTIEPAIYIPKFGGARLEDMVLITENGCEVLTK